MKTLQGRYKDDHYWEVSNAPLAFTTEKYVYIDLPPLTSSASERVATEPYHKQNPPNIGPFRIVKV